MKGISSKSEHWNLYAYPPHLGRSIQGNTEWNIDQYALMIRQHSGINVHFLKKNSKNVKGLVESDNNYTKQKLFHKMLLCYEYVFLVVRSPVHKMQLASD